LAAAVEEAVIKIQFTENADEVQQILSNLPTVAQLIG
jgi:hypothetical protein